MNEELTRVIGCQGSIQLITATSVVLNQKNSQGSSYRTYLIVYELYAPHGQDVDFFEFIKKMAETGPIKFEKIIYLTPELITSIEAKFFTEGLQSAQQTMCDLTGLQRIDELYLTSNWHRGNKILMHLIPASVKICYGDSIGLFIPEGYFEPQTFITRVKKIKLVRTLAYQWSGLKLYLKYRSRRPKFKILKPLKFNIGYYLTLELTKEKPDWPIVLTSRSALMNTFNSYLDCLSFDLDSDSILHQPKVVFFLTTNFSEAQKMSIENEIEAYFEYLTAREPEGTALIIKPHPRDSAKKLQRMYERFKDRYQVKVLDAKKDFFVPFELFLIMITKRNPEYVSKIGYHTFSSACLSIKILFDHSPSIGLGEDLVKKYFNSAFYDARIEHERDLKYLMTRKYQ